MLNAVISTDSIQFDYDVIAARRRVRQLAALLGFDDRGQTRLATVASAIARQALQRAGGGRLDLGIETREGLQQLVMTVIDNGRGEDDPAEATERPTVSRVRRLMDEVTVNALGRGSTIVMKKRLPLASALIEEGDLQSIVSGLSDHASENPLEEMQQQNEELLQALADFDDHQQELGRLNQELEDTNRGVLALYAELDEKAEHLRTSDHLKTRFLSDMSHEFRTPVNSILALAGLLEEGKLDGEARKQVGLIRRAADDLASLLSDLLDLAKIEAGKVDVRPAELDVTNLFSALRGMLRPLLDSRPVALLFDEPKGLPVMLTDEGKLSQILRNFISNALKFTESGEVRVSAELGKGGETAIFSVSDTGIGIAAEDQRRIFEDFTQIDHPLQRRHKGSGLGLPLTRKLAALLGGSVRMQSEPGSGSTFFAEIPLRDQGESGKAATSLVAARVEEPVPAGRPTLRVLVIDDDEAARYTVTSFAARPGTEIIEADNGLQGIARAQNDRPNVILLDLMMPGIGGHEVLQRLKSDPATVSIPVVVVTSRFINEEEKRQILSKANAVIYKGDLSRDIVTAAIDDALRGR
jgi:signal transduction histidine kinase